MTAGHPPSEREMAMMRWGMPPPPRTGGATGHEYPQHVLAALAGMAETGKPVSCSGEQFR